MSLPPRLQAIVADFELSAGKEKLDLLLEYAEKFQPLPERLKTDRSRMDPVPECMTPVSIYAQEVDGRLNLYFDIPPESPTIRGYAAILAEGLEGATAEEILAVPGDFYLHMGLQQVLSFLRINGMAAILAHIKQMAVRTMAG